MNHNFKGTIIGMLCLITLMYISYYVYRKMLGRQALNQLKGKQSSNVWTASTFFIVQIIILVSVSVLIVFMDLSLSARAYVSTCQSNDIEEGVCLNNFGREIYRDERLIIPDIKKLNPDFSFNTMLNVYEQNDLSLEEKRFYNARYFHNRYIDTWQDMVILENGLEVSIIDNNLEANRGVYLDSTSSLTVSFKNRSNRSINIDHESVVGVYLKDQYIPYILKDNDTQVLNPSEMIQVTYHYPVNVLDYSYYSIRIHSKNYTFREGR